MAELEIGTLYDMNKSLMAKEPLLDAIEVNQKIKDMIVDFYNFNYLMLLCNERRDFTIFKLRPITSEEISNKFFEDMKETILNRGNVISIDKQPDGAYEIWIRDLITNENFVYYLFDYSNAIVEV